MIPFTNSGSYLGDHIELTDDQNELSEMIHTPPPYELTELSQTTLSSERALRAEPYSDRAGGTSLALEITRTYPLS